MSPALLPAKTQRSSAPSFNSAGPPRTSIASRSPGCSVGEEGESEQGGDRDCQREPFDHTPAATGGSARERGPENHEAENRKAEAGDNREARHADHREGGSRIRSYRLFDPIRERRRLQAEETERGRGEERPAEDRVTFGEEPETGDRLEYSRCPGAVLREGRSDETDQGARCHRKWEAVAEEGVDQAREDSIDDPQEACESAEE